MLIRNIDTIAGVDATTLESAILSILGDTDVCQQCLRRERNGPLKVNSIEGGGEREKATHSHNRTSSIWWILNLPNYSYYKVYNVKRLDEFQRKRSLPFRIHLLFSSMLPITSLTPCGRDSTSPS